MKAAAPPLLCGSVIFPPPVGSPVWMGERREGKEGGGKGVRGERGKGGKRGEELGTCRSIVRFRVNPSTLDSNPVHRVQGLVFGA